MRLRPDHMQRRLLLHVAAAGAILLSHGAVAQRAQDNALTEAADAFGSSNGFQSIGLYSATDTRGFNPQQTGNLRIEGLYADVTTQYLSFCLVRSTSIRVGISAQSYDFQAPSGIADLALNVPGDAAGASFVASVGELGFSSTMLDMHSALSPTLSIGGCSTFTTNFLPDTNRQLRSADGAMLLRWQPTPQSEVIPFVQIGHGGEHGLTPQVYADGRSPVPRFRARALGAQDYTTQGWHNLTLGVVAHHRLASQWLLDGGLFHSVESDPKQFNEVYLLGPELGSAQHLLDVMPALRWASTSGEIKLTHLLAHAGPSGRIKFTLRGRHSDHGFGGDATVDYGLQALNVPLTTDPRPYTTGQSSMDRTRQWEVGAVWEERFAEHATAALGVLRSHYQRSLLSPLQAPVQESGTAHLPFLRLRLAARAGFDVYASSVVGLEDSPLAPSYADNHGEPPPATRSRQSDLGLQYTGIRGLSVTAGVFEIRKPYFAVDSANLYRQVGRLHQRGFELSARYTSDTLTALFGSVRLQPRLEDAGADGAPAQVPIGLVPQTHLLSLDWAPPAFRPWTATAQVTHLSQRPVTLDGRFGLAPLTVLNLGLRRDSRIHGHPFSVRLDLTNAANARGERISTQWLVTPEPGRRVQLTFALDN